MSRPRTLASAAFLVAVSVTGMLAIAAPAAAHVTVNPREAEQGGYARLAFRVPTESDTASTTKVEVVLPVDAPIASVSTMPVPGWTVALERGAPAKPVTVHGARLTEVVTRITWTATPAAAVKPGQFQEFPVSLGPLPEVDRLVFKALQTYSDGSVVRWIEEPAADGPEPESPAPVLNLVKATEEPAGGSVAGAAVKSGTGGADDGSDGGSGVALALAIAALTVALAGAALAGLAFARTRRATAP